MISFLGVLAINLGLAILGKLLQPKLKRSERPSLDVPFAEEGTPIPSVYGTQEINPTLMWYGDKEKVDGPSDSTQYRAKMQFALCIGPISKILDIQFGGKSLALAIETPFREGPFGGLFSLGYTSSIPFPIENPGNGQAVQFYVNDLYMFGGPKEGGGIAGMASVMFGHSDQEVDSLTEQAFDVENRSTYPNVAILSLGQKSGSYAFPLDSGQFEFCSNTGQPAAVKVILECIPYALLGSIDDARIGIDANPAEILYDLLTHRLRGAGLSEALIDKTQFLAKAQQYRDEGLGLSITLGNNQSVEEIASAIDDVCKYIDAVVFQDVNTGLFTIEDARGDVALIDMLEINKDNSSNFKMTPGQWSDTYNSFKMTYRAFNDGTNGHVDDEVVTTDFNGGWDGEQSYYLKGRNISNLVLTDVSNSNILTLGDDYKIESASRGKIQITDGGTGLVEDGHEIHAEYDASPTFMGFRDAVETTKSQMNRQITKDVRTLEVEYPFFTQKITAQRYINRLRRQNSVPIKRASWTMDASGFNLRPCQTVKINRPEWNLIDFPMVILNIDYGNLEEGYIKVEAAQDVFGDDYELASDASDDPVLDTTLPTAPSMSIICVSPGAIRIGLFSGNTAFNIEVRRSDDSGGAGATIISPSGGYPGTTEYIDDPWPETTTKYYEARLVRTGYLPGPWTPIIGCTATAGDPGVPVCTVPTWLLSKSETSLVGTAGVSITDPQARILSVEAKYKKGSDPVSSYEEISFPYEQEVDFVGNLTSSVWFRITYIGCDGLPLVFEEQVDFVAPILYSLSARFDIDGNLLADYAHSGGSVRIAGAIEATPADGVVDGTTPIDSSIGTTGALAGPATAGQTGTVKAVVYSGTGGTGRKSSYVTVSTVFGSTSGGGGGSASVDIVATANFDLRTVGESVELPIDDEYEIVEAEILAFDSSGVPVDASAVVDILRSADATPTTFASIAASAKPTLSTEKRVKDNVLTGWTTTLAANDTLRATLESSDAARVMVALKLVKQASVAVSVARVSTISRTLVIAGDIATIPIDADCEILEAEIFADASGSASVEVSRATDAGYDTFARIDNNVATALVAQQRVKDTALTGWDKNLSAGDTLKFRLATMGAGLTRVTFALKVMVGSLPGVGGFSGVTTSGRIVKAIGANTLADSALSEDADRVASDAGWAPKTRVVTGTGNMASDDHVIVCRGTFTLSLLAVSSYPNREIQVVNDGSGTVTVEADGTDLIAVGTAEAATYGLTQGMSLTLMALERSPTPNVWRVI